MPDLKVWYKKTELQFYLHRYRYATLNTIRLDVIR